MPHHDHQEEIRAAIGAHGQWKLTLSTAARTGSGDVDPDALSKSDRCSFGKFLAAVAPEMGADADYARIKQLHAQFHRQAGEIAGMIKAGQNEAALEKLSPTSEFVIGSRALTEAMTDWRLALKRSA